MAKITGKDDNFTRANGALGGGFVDVAGSAFTIASNLATCSTAGNPTSMALRPVGENVADQIAETYHNTFNDAFNGLFPIVAGRQDTNEGYMCYLRGTGSGSGDILYGRIAPGGTLTFTQVALDADEFAALNGKAIKCSLQRWKLAAGTSQLTFRVFAAGESLASFNFQWTDTTASLQNAGQAGMGGFVSGATASRFVSYGVTKNAAYGVPIAKYFWCGDSITVGLNAVVTAAQGDRRIFKNLSMYHESYYNDIPITEPVTPVVPGQGFGQAAAISQLDGTKLAALRAASVTDAKIMLDTNDSGTVTGPITLVNHQAGIKSITDLILSAGILRLYINHATYCVVGASGHNGAADTLLGSYSIIPSAVASLTTTKTADQLAAPAGTVVGTFAGYSAYAPSKADPATWLNTDNALSGPGDGVHPERAGHRLLALNQTMATMAIVNTPVVVPFVDPDYTPRTHNALVKRISWSAYTGAVTYAVSVNGVEVATGLTRRRYIGTFAPNDYVNVRAIDGSSGIVFNYPQITVGAVDNGY